MGTTKKVLIDKITDDSTNITITTRSVKWIVGILVTALLSLSGLAWGLYTDVNEKLDTVKKELISKSDNNQKEILQELKDLKTVDVKDNTITNYSQDKDIGILFDRTNSRSTIVNNGSRPTNTPNNLPPTN